MVQTMGVTSNLVVVVFMFGGLWRAASADQKDLFPELPVALYNPANQLCTNHTRVFMESLQNLTLWAYAMWESSARSHVGSLQGNTHQLGDFDECMNVPSPFPTQYCLLEIRMHVPVPVPPRDKYSTYYNPDGSVLDKFYNTGDKSKIPRNILLMGVCVPASCTYEDIEYSVNKYFNTLNKSNLYNITYEAVQSKELCQSNKSSETQEFRASDIAFCVLMLLLLLIVSISSMCDIKWSNRSNQKKQTMSAKLLLCFSAPRNYADLPRCDDSNEALIILYGVRTIAILMIIMDHRFGTFITGPVINREYVEEHYRSLASLFIFHGDLFVDSFFVLSGLLVTYSLLVSFEKRITPPLLIIFNRYIRLTPIYGVVVFYYSTLLYKTGSGPLWKLIVGNMAADCQNNWWASILYLGNYVNDENMCMVHTWYLPCDFHYFILAIPTIILIKRKPHTGMALLFCALIISCFIPFGITLYYQRPALLNFYIDFLMNPKVHPDFRLTYTKSHTRISAYIIGMFAGYIYYKLKNSSWRITFIKSNVLTFLGLALMFAGMASGGVYYDPYHGYNPIEAGLYSGLHRPAWALGSAILLLNASYGRLGLAKAILEWKPWIPLSKLVYGAYLVHLGWQLRSTASLKSPRYANVFDILTLALGDMMLSFSIAFILYLLVEAPCRKLFKTLMTPQTRISDKKVEVTVISNSEDSRL